MEVHTVILSCILIPVFFVMYVKKDDTPRSLV